MKTAFRFLVVIIVAMMTNALAQTASAQAPEPAAATTTSTEPQPVPSAVKSMYHVGFSQGVFSNWFENGPNGEVVFVDFQISGGVDYEESHYPQSPAYTSWNANEFWFSFHRTICPMGEAYCRTIADDYGSVAAGSLIFSGNERVMFTGAGYSFVFTADPVYPEGLTQEGTHNQTTDGPFCWHSRQNSMRRGTATLTLPDGSVMPASQGGSAYTDWNVEYREGNEYLPSCYGSGGGKG